MKTTSFQTKNNLYRYINSQSITSRAARFPFSGASAVQDWLQWILDNNDLSNAEITLVMNLIEAAKLDYESRLKYEKKL